MAGGIYVLVGDDELRELREAPYDKEDVLQELLARYPGLLAGDRSEESRHRWLLVAREVGVPDEESAVDRWSIDHLFLDEQGIPTLVEVKRSSDTRLRREVVGQMLDYAANALAHWPAEIIRARFEARCRTDDVVPDELIAEKLGFADDPESFWEQVKTNLQAGRLRLVFVADHIPRELRRIIEFLNAQMSSTEVLGLEVPQFVGEGIRSLVPRLVGQTEMAFKGRGPRKQWDEASFLSEFDKRGSAESTVAHRLVAWAKERGLRPWWGSGALYGTFVPYLDLPGNPGLTLLAVWTNGGLEVRLGNYGPARPPFDQPEKRAEFVDRLNRIHGVNLPESFKTAGVCKGIPLTAISSEKNLAQFIEVMDWALHELKTATASSAQPVTADAEQGA